MALKVHLSDNDSAVLEQIPARFPGTLSQLLTELKGLSEVLLHVEAHLVKEVNEQARVIIFCQSIYVLTISVSIYLNILFFLLVIILIICCYRNH